jgi:transglutaminase-like putative cysteine protease
MPLRPWSLRYVSNLVITLLFILTPALRAQEADRAARAAQWDAYAPPAGELKRLVDPQKGFALWVPSDWKEAPFEKGRLFTTATGTANLIILTEEIPEGLGTANYANANVQQLRSQRMRPDSLTVRCVWLNGLEWRELAYELEAPNGVAVHQTMWLTAHGARAFAFACSFQPAEQQQIEPLFKRIISSARILAASSWDEKFEQLRAGFTASATTPAPLREWEAGQLAAAIRAASAPQPILAKRLSELFASAPDTALDLLTDASLHVRTAAIKVLGQHTAQTKDARWVDALCWALKDKDSLASTAAAQALAALPATAYKSKLTSLAETPAGLVRLSAALNPTDARELAEELWRSNSEKQTLAALQIALILPRLDFALPYARLFAASDVNVLHTTIAVLQRHRPADAQAELLKLWRGDTEAWAARALGDVGSADLAARFEVRTAEIDKRLGTIVTTPKKPSKRAGAIEVVGRAAIQPYLVATADIKTKPEEVRLALARGEIVAAFNKLKLRERFNQAKDEAAHKKLLAEVDKEQSDLSEWARTKFAPSEAPAALPTFDPAKFKDAPSTGETFFPANTLSYVLAPNVAATLDKLDAALAGVQMATVRDQMTLALYLNIFKASLAAKFGATETKELSDALGLDLKAPVALASWPSARKGDDLRHGITLRVTDRMRLERLLALYQEDYGELDSLATAIPLFARTAALLPAAVPVVFGAIASPEFSTRLLPKTTRIRGSLPAAMPTLAYQRQERFGELPVTIFEKQKITLDGDLETKTLWLAYLGDTALVASSRTALVEMLRTAAAPTTSLGQTAAFTRARREQGEMVFFSQLGEVLKQLGAAADLATDEQDIFTGMAQALGLESGALQLSPTAWETAFNLTLSDNDYKKSLQPFKVETLAAPRELLPQDTVLYGAAIVDPPALLKAIKNTESTLPKKVKEPEAAARSKEFDDDTAKLLVPHMQGELAAALISLKPLFDPQLAKGSNGWPALIFAAKLKDKELAALHQAGKFFATHPRVPDTKVFGGPVIALGNDNDAPFVAINDYYFIIADSVATLRLLEKQQAEKESFANAREFKRSTQGLPGNLALFATYNLEAAFEEARRTMQGSQYENLLPFISAITHAFHSQRAYITLEPDSLQGRLAIAFDREGRYAVGNVTRPGGEFDVANALIAPRGLNIIHAPRIESLTVRATAKQPGIAPRVRDDLSKFPWQRIESSDERTLVFSSAARRIATAQTIKLPVTGTDFTKYLGAEGGIRPDAPDIRKLAQEIAGKETDGRTVARKLGEWTYANLKWKKVQSDTIETLASREADCLEHSELYVALARSRGLPARVVVGAALSGGAFGAHAWVEVYLGQWVELDPTWGLMEHVDATHLRFDGNSFAEYAMLNQLDLEISSARTVVADYQRDPVKLVQAFGPRKEFTATAFDLALTAEAALGAGAWEKLTDRQRNAAITAFERTVRAVANPYAGILDNVEGEDEEDLGAFAPRVLHREVNGQRATILALRDDELLRFTLQAREGAWFITEVEDVDAALPQLSDALREALNPGQSRAKLDDIEIETALKRLDEMIATRGETPELLLHKANLLEQQESREMIARLNQQSAKANETSAESAGEKSNGKTGEKPVEMPAEAKPDIVIELRQKVVARWPNYAPAQLALGRSLIWGEEDKAKRAARHTQAIAALQQYAKLAPYDPRPWTSLASIYDQQERLDEAEAAYHAAITRVPADLSQRNSLLFFHFEHEQADKARTVFGEMLKVAPKAEAAFAALIEDDDAVYDFGPQLETLLLAFPKEVGASKTALLTLAEAQNSQDKTAAATKTLQRALALKPADATVHDYAFLAQLLRKGRRFAETVTAASKALTLGEAAATASALFERACARAQLGLKKAALADLRQLIETGALYVFQDDDPDLKPLAALPEFKTLVEQVKQSRAAEEGETPKPDKP